MCQLCCIFQVVSHLIHFGNSALPMDQYSKLFAEARAFILACYNMADCASLNEARVQVCKNKMKQNSLEPPKLS